MLGDKRIIAEMRVGGGDAIEFGGLSGAEGFTFVEAPNAFQQTLTAQHLMNARDAAGEVVRRVEERRVHVGDFVV